MKVITPTTGNTDITIIPRFYPTTAVVVSLFNEASQVTTTPAATKKQFYGTISLDPVKAKMDFATIMDEVVQQFTAKLGVNVRISVEIEANSQDGFNESMQRTVKENCNVLKFS